MMFDIDYVFPGVNNTDKVGRESFVTYCKKHNMAQKIQGIERERYRDGGLLKFLLRGIAQNMPGIRTLHLIVSNPEQVPSGINQENIHIVLHKDIIPIEFLPTFNSTTIEMFLAQIPDLAEHFIYGNDDMYPMSPSEPLDGFTEDGIPRFNMHQVKISAIHDKQYRVVCSKQGGLLQRLCKIPKTQDYYYRPGHGLVPLVKSKCQEVIDLIGMKAIQASLTAFRTDYNMNQYIYTDYMNLIGYQQKSEIQFEYMGIKDPQKLLDIIKTTNMQVICLNDCHTNMNLIQLARLQVLCAEEFEKRFPHKCKYEN